MTGQDGLQQAGNPGDGLDGTDEAFEDAVRVAAFALANPGALPEWMQMVALGRDMAPIARLTVKALWPVIPAAVRDRAAAEERQRIIALAAGMCTSRDRVGRPLPDPHPADHMGPCPYGEVVQRILATSPVPVANPEPTRLVLVDHREAGAGRVVDASDVRVRLDYQDKGRTLKIFMTDGP